MAKSVKVGDKVKTTAVKDWNGTHLASFVRKNTYDVIQVGGKNLSANRIVIGKGKAVTAAVHLNTLTVVSSKSKKTTTKKVTTKKNTKKDTSKAMAQRVLNKQKNTSNNLNSTHIDGSKVQYGTDRFGSAEKEYLSEFYLRNLEMRKKNDKLNDFTKAEQKKMDQSHPTYVQNDAKYPFPTSLGLDEEVGFYRYDYTMDYETDKLDDGKAIFTDSERTAIDKWTNTDMRSRKKLIEAYTSKYNKYKVANPNDALSKSFAHVFFVRPDCHIFKSGTSGKDPNPKLIPALENLSEFYYAKKHSPEILRQLTQAEAGYNNQFMMLPSNKAKSFEIKDEAIIPGEYGQGLTGYKIAYGKDNVASRTADTFTISYVDDRDLHVYNMHKLWIDYISYVYRGKVTPKATYNLNKVLDYATCVYYILCAEDGETVIFWSKYWGVFPLDAPSSAFSYSSDTPGTVHTPEFRIQYQYSWKEDFNPLSMIEFNMHSAKNSYPYNNSYQSYALGTGYTWTGAPFIETFNGGSNKELPYTFKLRFRPS